MELSGGWRESGGDCGEERESSGDWDFTDAQFLQCQVEVSHCPKQERGEVFLGGGIEHGVTYGDEGNFGTRVKREDMAVEPAECEGTVGGESRKERIWDGEKKGNVGECEGFYERWVSVWEADAGDLEGRDSG